ncbi:hypothetical protein SYJ56_20310 [Algoriphagus sp. D3-2-R+10]|uniref:hypothetical protein n=1 Tax=Algoriphagus aurantiacus TaxID=3103948 RepID=UPI002B364362|nr:hypothetical protein [Algoriphagus sp. D3-2-R+10]MEB2777670.1 hypothetical protein [Algoriphagus sp. D3-2-R+10]
MSESSIFDSLKNQWKQQDPIETNAQKIDLYALHGIIKLRMKKQNKQIMGYFWMTLTMHIGVYAVLGHVGIRWGMNDLLIAAISIFGILVTIPFTWMLMKKFKQMASNRAENEEPESLKAYIQRKRQFLSDFFHFKSIYEWFIIPVHSALGVFISFYLWVPGGVGQYQEVAAAIYLVTLASCIYAIHSENRNNFKKPIQEMDEILSEFRD